MSLCVTPFIALATSMYFRLKGDGMGCLVGVGAIGIACVAFLLDLRRQPKIAE
jgi:hypothetical protein